MQAHAVNSTYPLPAMDVVYIQNKCVVLRIQWNWLCHSMYSVGNASIKLPKLSLVAMQLPEKYQEISTFRAKALRLEGVAMRTIRAFVY